MSILNVSETTDTDLLSLEECIKIVNAKENVVKLIADAEKRLLREALEGKPVEGFKVVEAATHRKFSDQEKARNVLIRQFSKNEVIIEKLITPAQMDTLIESKPTMREATKLKLYELVVKPKGGPKLVKEDHPGKPWMFQDLLAKPIEEQPMKKFW